MKINLEDFGIPDDNISDEAERIFNEHYLHHLGGGGARFVRLESSFNVKCRDRVLIPI